MNPIDALTELFSKLPGIGPRQAKRLVYYLMKTDPAFLENFSKHITNLRQSISQCSVCFRFFSRENTSENTNQVCPLCRDPNCDPAFMMVLEKDIDLEKIQKSGVYSGKYFLLGGTLPFFETKPTTKIRVKEFLNEVERRARNENLKEITFALSANPEGEHTVEYLKKELEPIIQKYTLKITTLGRGLSTGTEIEYSDHETLKNAFLGRK